ncbi:hypothetical protein LOTGIDRAFT_104289 [Lottia gigantea]|uniref:DNA repair endonuclease XPF n=1 Tax=Lottia gigantea TaxID=225164 RepID=V4C7S3_LOTGI|nr:hypothetical protein LOTGIDRAFT_104289 [Lottia gigantea]ESO97764.1 hypothetical protein LOTGIDRAFT_104289 [Lottia gigantea]
MALLEYENMIFLDAFQEDGLTILAQGLGIQRIFINFLKVCSDPENLVLVLNTSSSDEEYFLEQLETASIKPLPKVITNEINANTRHSTYLQGGVVFVTSRILVVDLLTDRVPVDQISGILVYKAHKIIESCQEAFILRLYRQKNKTGFIKAFSDSPYSFTTGFCHVERMMKNLFVRKLFLWPRFHASVVACLEKHQVEVVEIHLHMTQSMTACQTALLDLINACIKELKRCTTAVDTEEVTVENALGKSFDKTIRLQLDPVWNSLGQKTRQLVSDLKTLRLLLKFLTQYDCVSFYSLVHSIRSNEKTFGQNTGWLFLDAADSLFVHARDRVYEIEDKKKKLKSDDKYKEKEPEPLLEDCPKWKALTDLLKEIEEENKDADRSAGPTNVLVCAEDDRTCSQLKEYLCEGGRSILFRLYNKFMALKGAQQTDQERFKFPKKKTAYAKEKAESDELTLTQMMVNMERENDGDLKPDNEADSTPHSSQDAYYGVISAPVTILHPLHGCSDPHGLTRVLQEIQPRYVILYDADMQLVRQLEVFRASRPGVPLRVYFLMYKNSVEEQCYLTTLRKEKEAFEHLIEQKGKMVIEEQCDGKLDEDPSLARNQVAANETTNSRKGGLVGEPKNRKIIVDMREFRSELPSLIHRRGIEIEPVTLEVGDYILTPDICVERKSISDLIGSLSNGRLYNQCVAMCRYYKRPILLIEFDANKSFSLQGKYALSNDVSMKDISSQLALLTMHFPKLRNLWCQSPYATAELFDELKENRGEPDSVAAMSVSASETTDDISDRYSHGPQDFLLKMPGVNSKNFKYIMNKVKDLAELVSLSEEKLTEIMGSCNHANRLYEFLHTNVDEAEKASAELKKNEKPFKKGYGFKKRK